MGFVGFLNFGLKCIQLLAWPSLALGYPLCASIRAIETNSNYHMRKLVTYWILFSLISLFEHAFEKLIEWVPFWPYIKILAVCWLVIPSFGGAYNAYKSLVRPCLSLHLLEVVVINLLNKKQELSLKGETFLAVAERYVNENGTEALENLIAKKAKHVDTNLSRTQQKLGTSTEIKELTSAATVRDYVLPLPPTLRIQKEWTCVECQVKTTCEVAFNSHLQGRKHKSKCEKLKSSMQAMKVEGSSSTASNQEPKEDVSVNRLGQKKTQKAEEKAVELEKNLTAPDKIQSNNKVPNVSQNDTNAVEHEENVVATEKISNSKVPNVSQNDINAVEHEENVVATDKIQSNSNAPIIAQNDINAVEPEENVAATDNIQSNIKAPNVAQNDINTVEHEENVAATDKIVNLVDTNLSRTQQKLCTSTEVKELTSAATVSDYVLPVPLTLRIPKEWTCVVCQVKTTCEVVFNSHLQGRKHKSKCEKLKSSMQAMKVEGSSSTASNQEPKEDVSGNRLGQKKTQKAEEKAVELEENLTTTVKIQSNSKVPNVSQNDINAVEHEENVAATDKIQSNSNAPNIAQNDINAVEPEENVAATDKIVKHVDTNLSRTQQKLGTSTEVKEVTSATTVSDYVLPVPPTLRIQKEWTCDVCQVKTKCEVTFNSHLQGRKHKSKCEKLKSSMQAMKLEGSSSTASNQEPKKAVSGNRLCQNKTQKAEEKLKFDVNSEQWKPRKPVNAAAGIIESKYWSSMHNVSCSGEIDMAAHLNGRRHLSLFNEFDDILGVPNYGAMVPQAFNGLPNYGAVVPQGFNGVPNYGAMVPQAFNEVPNYGAMVPQAFNGVPNTGAMFPQGFNGVPNSGAMVPQGWE